MGRPCWWDILGEGIPGSVLDEGVSHYSSEHKSPSFLNKTATCFGQRQEARRANCRLGTHGELMATIQAADLEILGNNVSSHAT